MKTKTLVVLLFSIWLVLGSVILVFTGGATGKFGVNNMYIILFAFLIAVTISYSSIQMVRGKKSGYYAVVTTLTMLTFIFAYRFYTTGVIAPPGLYFLITLTILLYFIFGENKNKITKK